MNSLLRGDAISARLLSMWYMRHFIYFVGSVVDCSAVPPAVWCCALGWRVLLVAVVR